MSPFFSLAFARRSLRALTSSEFELCEATQRRAAALSSPISIRSQRGRDAVRHPHCHLLRSRIQETRHDPRGLAKTSRQGVSAWPGGFVWVSVLARRAWGHSDDLNRALLIRAQSSPCARAVERVDVRYGPFERSAPEDVPRAKPALHANGTLRQRSKLTAPKSSSRGRRPPDRADNRNLPTRENRTSHPRAPRRARTTAPHTPIEPRPLFLANQECPH